jgi:sugar-specific transcriptional regulator TrmB
MLIREDDVETLTGLGLTERQAKLYLALHRLGVSKVEAISKESKIHRQEIYRVVSGLQELGLVERKVITPTMFGAIPIDEALHILFDRKNKELNAIRRKARRLTEHLSRIDSQIAPPPKGSYFNIISGGEHSRKFKEATDNAQKCINLITNCERFRLSFSILHDSIKTALKRGVLIQVITEKPASGTFPTWVAQILASNNSNLKLKSIAGPPSVCSVVYDNFEVALCINEFLDFRGAHLWSNNQSFVTLYQAYFDSEWVKAGKVTL